MAIYDRRKGMKHFLWALTHLHTHIDISIFLYPQQEPERGGVSFLLEVKIQRLKAFGFLAQGHNSWCGVELGLELTRLLKFSAFSALFTPSPERWREGMEGWKGSCHSPPQSTEQTDVLVTSRQEPTHPLQAPWSLGGLALSSASHLLPCLENSGGKCRWSSPLTLRWGLCCLLRGAGTRVEVGSWIWQWQC